MKTRLHSAVIQRSTGLLAALLLAGAATSATGATLVVKYDADAETPTPLPNTEAGGGWAFFTDPGTPRTGMEEIMDVNYNYITPNQTNGSSGSYDFLTGDTYDGSQSWTATALIRAISVGASQDNLLASYVRIFDGTHQFMMSFMNNSTTGREGVVLFKNGMGLDNQTDITNNLIPLELSDNYVSLQMRYLPAVGEDPATLSLYADGVWLATINSSSFSPSTVPARIRWGKNTAWGSDVRWNEVSLIPEPSTAALLGLGVLGWAGMRRRKSRR